MGLGSTAGRAHAKINDPVAQGECDRCGFWWPLDDLRRQFQWAGPSLIDTGYLVCRRCLDVPFEQYRVLVLPPDPIPRKNPRQSHDITGIWPIGTKGAPTTPWNQSFTPYVLDSVSDANYPTTKADVLNQIASVTGIPIPTTLNDYAVTLTQNRTVNIMGANTNRNWLLVYSPVVPPAALSKTTALWGATTNLMTGPGQAWFQAAAQQLAPTYTGPLTAIGLIPSMPLFAWDGSTSSSDFTNDGGVLAMTADFGYPESADGLPPGAVWNNGMTVAVVPGIAPSATAPAIYYPAISAFYLQMIGGGNLPLTPQADGSGQLWNNGGMISIS